MICRVRKESKDLGIKTSKADTHAPLCLASFLHRTLATVAWDKIGRCLFICLGTVGTLLVGPRVASSLSALGTELQVRCLWNISIAWVGLATSLGSLERKLQTAP